MSLGDYAVGGMVRFRFSTFADNAPITLAGTPALAVYKDAGLVEIALGITLTVDFDGRTGMHLVEIDLSADAAYTAGEYDVVITEGTVAGASRAGWVLEHFSIGRYQAMLAELNNLSAAEVNAEVVDALSVDVYAEPGQELPGATISLARKISYLYKAWRNRHTQTADTYALYGDNAATIDQQAAVSDDATTFDRGEVGTGV